MREIRLALLEADVNFRVVKDFTSRVKERALGADVIGQLNPGQQVVRIVHEEPAALMGGAGAQLAFAPRPPTVILMAGLQGSGKTTATDVVTAARRTPQRPARRKSADRAPQGRAVPGPAIERLVEHVEQQSDAPVGAHRGLRASQRGTIARWRAYDSPNMRRSAGSSYNITKQSANRKKR